MVCVWVAPPTCMSRGLRAYQGVYAHTQGLTCERTMWLSGRYHPGQAPDNVREQPIPPGTAQNADHFATSSPVSAFITEVVCVLGAAAFRQAPRRGELRYTNLQGGRPSQVVPPPSGENCTTRGSDTPATRRQKASHGAKPPSPPQHGALEHPQQQSSGTSARRPDTTSGARARYDSKGRPTRTTGNTPAHHGRQTD